ncbi:MAG: CidA/LrgA family protein [Gammaproteobacteria bacterium]|nr:CidA/LrgA family protein [Gammaproteobacteria bacterium]
MAFLHGITLLLLFQLIGELLVHLGQLPLPGPVAGMALLFITLILRRGLPESLSGAATSLLGHLSLLFVPAGVGVMLHFDKLAGDWLAIAAALLLGTLITLALTALLMQLLLRWQR